MESLRHRAVRSLDGAIVGVGGDGEDFVVVFCFGSFEHGLGFLEEGLDGGGGRVMFFCCVEG